MLWMLPVVRHSGLALPSLIVATLLALAVSTAYAQVRPRPAQPAPPGLGPSANSGTLSNALVRAVIIRTESEIGPYTAFQITTTQPDAPRYWYFIRNDDNAKALERGAIIGLLMGALQTYRWSEDARTVNIHFVTINEMRVIDAASLGAAIPE